MSTQATRIEHDLLGEKAVPADAYSGVQTARALENFHVSGVELRLYPNLIKAFAMVKLAAARANVDCGQFPREVLTGIEGACRELIDGKLHDAAGYAQKCTQHLAAITGLPIHLADDLIEATQDTQAFVLYSSCMKSLAIKLSKVCNDLRLLSSGPRCGFREINLPAKQPGSSIMPSDDVRIQVSAKYNFKLSLGGGK